MPNFPSGFAIHGWSRLIASPLTSEPWDCSTDKLVAVLLTFNETSYSNTIFCEDVYAPTPLSKRLLHTFFKSPVCMPCSYYLAVQLLRIIVVSPQHFLL